MDVSRNYKRRVQFDEVGLANKDGLGLLYKHFDLLLGQVHRADSEVRSVRSDVVANLQQGVDDIVELIVIDFITIRAVRTYLRKRLAR